MGYYRVLGKGKLPKHPVLVKAKFFSQRAKEKIKGVGGTCVIKMSTIMQPQTTPLQRQTVALLFLAAALHIQDLEADLGLHMFGKLSANEMKRGPLKHSSRSSGRGVREASASPQVSFDLDYDRRLASRWKTALVSIATPEKPSCGAMGVRWSFPGSSLATQKAARRPPTGAIPALRPGQRGWGKGESKPTSTSACLPFPKPELGPSAPAALSLQFPLAAAQARFGKETESPPRLRRLGFGRRWGAADAFPRNCGEPGSGKVFQSSQQRLPGSPPLGEQTAASAPASPPPLPLLPPAARSGRLARGKRAGLPAGRPSSGGESRS
ncbi:hypothetical protein QTO34_001890 [Cnephaeus nilssonii]|uniref:Large ribosomal subunit protein uL15 n=1 Tax=Cnephaeus nilssonii TaxID=3371016 RepID=A0AA40HUQ6_CNENI|nr:hypothetical protein QTO34_001890 [Eptesicus nilssonii]